MLKRRSLKRTGVVYQVHDWEYLQACYESLRQQELVRHVLRLALVDVTRDHTARLEHKA